MVKIGVDVTTKTIKATRKGLLTFMFPVRMYMNESSDDRKGLKQTFPDNRNIVNGLCQSLKNVADYRLQILKEVEERMRNASIWEKG
jgi:hypothetical protein